MDLVMPNKTGFTAVKEMLQHPEVRDTPIIAVSASVLEEAQKMVFDIGCRAFIPRPVNVDNLLEVLQKQLDLEWTYTMQDEEQDVSQFANLKHGADVSVLPPSIDLKKLYDLVQSGNMQSIKTWAQDIEQQDSKYVPFATYIYKLADEYDDKTLIEFVKRFINNEDDE